MLFPENMGEYLSIDEVSLSQGELYTFVTNKNGRGKKGTLVASIKGTLAKDISDTLELIPLEQRKTVKEVTLDMAANMNLIIKRSFPKASRVIDRFHVQKLASEAVQNIRIKYRWKAINNENHAIEQAKKNNTEYEPVVLSNGDTIKQLLVRIRHLLFKPENRWASSQVQRAKLLFQIFPDIKRAYELAQQLTYIYENNTQSNIAIVKLAKWYNSFFSQPISDFNTVAKSIQVHYQGILNYFDNRSTNASAESFNAKLKSFRNEFKGVRDSKFFLFRLTNIFA